MIASGRAELDQIKLDIVEKIPIHERMITDLMRDIDGSSKNASMLRSDLYVVWNNCQEMKNQMNQLLQTLKLEFNLMKEQSIGNVEGVKSLTSEMMRAIEGKWKEWKNNMVNSIHEQMENVTGELRASLVYTDGRVKRVEELVFNIREDGRSWMDYSRDLRDHFARLDKDKDQRLAFVEEKLQRKAALLDLKVRAYDNVIDTLKETTCKCGDKR